MTTKLEQAARQALEFFESGDFVYPTDLATALREALAEQAEQEPVAWCYFCEDELWGFFTDPDECDPDCDNEMSLYAAPVRTKDLTDDELFNLLEQNYDGSWDGMICFARVVISADREKNK